MNFLVEKLAMGQNFIELLRVSPADHHFTIAPSSYIASLEVYHILRRRNILSHPHPQWGSPLTQPLIGYRTENLYSHYVSQWRCVTFAPKSLAVTDRVLHRIHMQRPRSLTFICYDIRSLRIIWGNPHILVVTALVTSEHYNHLPRNYLRYSYALVSLVQAVVELQVDVAILWDVAPCSSYVERRFGEHVTSILRFEIS
jgi:hypothetical protein